MKYWKILIAILILHTIGGGRSMAGTGKATKIAYRIVKLSEKMEDHADRLVKGHWKTVYGWIRMVQHIDRIAKKSGDINARKYHSRLIKLRPTVKNSLRLVSKTNTSIKRNGVFIFQYYSIVEEMDMKFGSGDPLVLRTLRNMHKTIKEIDDSVKNPIYGMLKMINLIVDIYNTTLKNYKKMLKAYPGIP